MILSLKKLEDIKAVIFDLGGTLYTLPYSIEAYHMKYLKEVLGDDFIVTTEELDRAHDAAETALSNLVDDNATGPAYQLSTEEWVFFDRVLLENLGVKENIEQKSRE